MKYIISFPLLLLVISNIYATPSLKTSFIGEYPSLRETKLDSCTTCHMPVVKDFLNQYGLDLKQSKINFKAIEGKDSDGDGTTNIQELNGSGFPGSFANFPEYFIFTNKKGDIHFNHESHVAGDSYVSKGNCKNCHDPTGTENSELFPRRFDDRILIKSTAHRVCWKCHRESGSENAPTKCNGCHSN